MKKTGKMIARMKNNRMESGKIKMKNKLRVNKI